MLKLYHYSEDKFKNFSPERQAKAMIQMLCALENSIAEASCSNSLLQSVLECFHWSDPDVQEQFSGLAILAEPKKPHELMKLITPILRSVKNNYDENEREILRFDGSNSKSELLVPFPVTVVLDNLRSAYNVGSIFRTAECVQVNKLFLCGISPTPPHPRLIKTAMGTEERVAWQYFPDTMDAVIQLKKQGIPVIALETTSDAKSIFDYQVTQHVAMIVGNEALGIEEKILALADEILHIPIHGWKNSLNVCNAFAIAAYRLSGIS